MGRTSDKTSGSQGRGAESTSTTTIPSQVLSANLAGKKSKQNKKRLQAARGEQSNDGAAAEIHWMRDATGGRSRYFCSGTADAQASTERGRLTERKAETG
jgi:hypothetical protein